MIALTPSVHQPNKSIHQLINVPIVFLVFVPLTFYPFHAHFTITFLSLYLGFHSKTYKIPSTASIFLTVADCSDTHLRATPYFPDSRLLLKRHS